MVTPLSVVQFVAGLAVVIYFAETLVDGTVDTARGFGLSAFLISVIFIGFDPENLFVGASGTYEGVAGIALGAIVGAAMVAIALAFGITALLAPMEFEEAPTEILAAQVLAVLLFGGLALDGELPGSTAVSSSWVTSRPSAICSGSAVEASTYSPGKSPNPTRTTTGKAGGKRSACSASRWSRSSWGASSS